VVPTTLELTARALVESQVVITGDALTMPANNQVRNSATVVVDHFLEAVSTANGTTAWYLFKDPACARRCATGSCAAMRRHRST